MNIQIDAMAGTLESSDLLVKVSPHPEGRLEVAITSEVMRQFGKQIRKVVEETLDRLEVRNAQVIVEDKGALDCTLRARVQAAALRASGSGPDWKVLA